jgi:hypothetical protein
LRAFLKNPVEEQRKNEDVAAAAANQRLDWPACTKHQTKAHQNECEKIATFTRVSLPLVVQPVRSFPLKENDAAGQN